MTINKKMALIGMLLASSISFASDCPDNYPYGKPIHVPKTIEVCYDGFVVVYDAFKNAPLFSSAKTQQISSVKRSNDFHRDVRVPSLTMLDYYKSGYDKGHLTPAEWSNTKSQMNDTFSMVNMVPEDPHFNRGPWKSLEMSVRKMKTDHVVTGAYYEPPQISIGPNQIPVPKSVWKVVYKTNGDVLFSIGEKKSDSTVSVISRKELENKIGYSLP